MSKNTLGDVSLGYSIYVLQNVHVCKNGLSVAIYIFTTNIVGEPRPCNILTLRYYFSCRHEIFNIQNYYYRY